MFFTGFTTKHIEEGGAWLNRLPQVKAALFPETIDQETMTLSIKGEASEPVDSLEFSFDGAQNWYSIGEMGGQVLSFRPYLRSFEVTLSIEPHFFFGQLNYQFGSVSPQNLKSFLVRAISKKQMRTTPLLMVVFYKLKEARMPASLDSVK